MVRDQPRWTPQQRRAIELTGGDVLVTASAGTGKTAVLAERVLRLVRDPGAGVDIDRLLVVTFTRAAAAEMRRRIAAGLAGRGGADAAGRHLERQLVLLDRAAIGTLHSACGRIVREHHRELGLDPAFRVLSAGEARRLRSAVAAEVFESAYSVAGEAGRAFRELIDDYGAPLSDEPVVEAVLRLDEFLSSLPDPDGWMARQQAAEPDRSPTRSEGAPNEVPRTLASLRAATEGGLRTLLQRELTYLSTSAARLLAEAAGGLREHLARIADELGRVRMAVASASLDESLAALAGFDAGRRPAGAEDSDEDLRSRVAELRSRISRLRRRFAGATAEGLHRDQATAARHVRALLDITARFRTAVAARKDARNVLDFADLERQTLRLLTSDDGGDTPAARRLRERYEHILVDEYQDISPLQDAVLERLSRPAGNRFLVGDVKQSIYAFRQADPSLFLHRLAAAGREETTIRRVDLTGNFRSSSGVIDAVNAMMGRLMVAGLGGIDYDAAARLTFAGSAVEARAGLPPLKLAAMELHFVDVDSAPGPIGEADGADEAGEADDPAESAAAPASAHAREAAFVADRIRRMVVGAECRSSTPGGRGALCGAEFSVRDAGRVRPVEWRDVAILLRGLRGRADVYAEALRAAGVPVAAPPAGGELSVEARDVVNLLRVLDNPRHDLPLLGLLRSPMIGLRDTELTEMRLASPEGAIWDTLCAAADKGSGRAAAAAARIDEWRTECRLRSPADAIARAFRETGYPTYVCGLPGGLRRRGELRALLDRARRLQARTPGGAGPGALADLLAEADGDDEADIGPPASADLAENAVRILSIHRSKGLEFPVVVLPDLGRKFNLRELDRDFLWSRGGGLGLTRFDRAARVRRPTLGHVLVADELRQARLAEELRLLYVGLTRARDALVLSAAGSRRRDLPRWSRRIGPAGTAGPLPDDVLAAARCPADWVFAAAAAGAGLPAVAAAGTERRRDGGTERRRDEGTERRRDEGTESLGGGGSGGEEEQPRALVPPSLSPSVPPSLIPSVSTSPVQAAAEGILNRLEWRYPHEHLAAVPAHRTVARLTGGRSESVQRPRFLSADAEAEPTPAEMTAALRRLMRDIDLAGDTDAAAFAALWEGLVGRGLIPAHIATRIEPAKLAAFFRSEVGKRLRARPADVRRDVAVEFVVPAGDIVFDLPPSAAAEPVAVRGVIDALLPEDAGFRLLEYGVAGPRGAPSAERLGRFRSRAALWRRAVMAIWGREISRATLCLLDAGRFIDA